MNSSLAVVTTFAVLLGASSATGSDEGTGMLYCAVRIATFGEFPCETPSGFGTDTLSHPAMGSVTTLRIEWSTPNPAAFVLEIMLRGDPHACFDPDGGRCWEVIVDGTSPLEASIPSAYALDGVFQAQVHTGRVCEPGGLVPRCSHPAVRAVVDQAYTYTWT